MFISSNVNALLLMVMSTLLLVTFGHQNNLGDDLCQAIPNPLCVEKTLLEIATKVKSINRTIQAIEKHIIEQHRNIDTFNRHVNLEMGLISSHVPSDKQHAQFFTENNIDQKALGRLLHEAHDAMSVYYNSIKEILELNDLFAFTVDGSLAMIQSTMRDIICSYRSVLRVYSQNWLWLDQIGGLPFSKNKYRSAPSLIHDVRSVIILRFLRDWTTRINGFVNNLEAKFV